MTNSNAALAAAVANYESSSSEGEEGGESDPQIDADLPPTPPPRPDVTRRTRPQSANPARGRTPHGGVKPAADSNLGDAQNSSVLDEAEENSSTPLVESQR